MNELILKMVGHLMMQQQVLIIAGSDKDRNKTLRYLIDNLSKIILIKPFLQWTFQPKEIICVKGSIKIISYRVDQIRGRLVDAIYLHPRIKKNEAFFMECEARLKDKNAILEWFA